MLLACMLLFGGTYVAIYWRIVRFKTPRWMVFRGDVMGGAKLACCGQRFG
jgi:hypothetical protein